jgi:DNA-binding LacI/PurR family transcriptional regulator
MARQRPMGRTTLTEVANLAGVSPATASLVLTGKAVHRGIPDETNEKVRKAAEELNYVPNLLVRSLRRGRTQVISFYNAFRHRFQRDLYMDRLSSSIECAGGEFGYDVLVHSNFSRTTRETYEFLNGGLADGLLFFAPMPNDPLLELLRKSDLPVVLINGRDPMRRYPSVMNDNGLGMRLVADKLLEHGHRRVAALTVGPGYLDADERIGILRGYLGAEGIDTPDEWIVDFDTDRRAKLSRLLDRNDRPTALFCWHDRVAYWALETCEQLGIRVPEQLSIIGYDGIQWPAATSSVAASVVVDLEDMAHRGLRILDHYIRGYEGPLIEETLPVSFSAGTSLAPAPTSTERNHAH